MRKAREIGNNYSESFSRDGRSLQRAHQQREIKQMIYMAESSPEKDISANIEINLNVSSIKKQRDDTLDDQIIHDIKQMKRVRQSKQSFSRKQSIAKKTDKFEKYATSLRFINFNFGAVLQGYKARRIYFNNSLIRQYRIEYRDLIQFAFML
jgi:hypothetical protein